MLSWLCDLGRTVELLCLVFFNCLRELTPTSLDCYKDHPDNIRERSGIKTAFVYEQ